MRYYEIFFADRNTRQLSAAPLFRICAENAADAKRKANKEVLRDGRSRRFDLAWTDARHVKRA